MSSTCEGEQHPCPYSSQPLVNSHSFDLPADVFVEGETKPTRTKKAKGITRAGEAAGDKRSFEDTGLDVRDRGIIKTNIPRRRR